MRRLLEHTVASVKNQSMKSSRDKKLDEEDKDRFYSIEVAYGEDIDLGRKQAEAMNYWKGILAKLIS